MDMTDPYRAIESTLREEIDWLLKQPHLGGWNPYKGAAWNEDSALWGPVIDRSGTPLGCCAIAAMLIHRQPRLLHDDPCNVNTAAHLLGIPHAWANHLYRKVTVPAISRRYIRDRGRMLSTRERDIIEVAFRLRDYGDNAAVNYKIVPGLSLGTELAR